MAKWQKHWSNSSNDPRLQLLISEMGAKGYGIYWLISEQITGNENGSVLLKDIIKRIQSRRLNRQYIERVIDKYFLFEQNMEGFVFQHRIQIGDMNAHLLHQLMTGEVKMDAALYTVHTKNGMNGDQDHTLYITRAGENITTTINNNHESDKTDGATGDNHHAADHNRDAVNQDRNAVSQDRNAVSQNRNTVSQNRDVLIDRLFARNEPTVKEVKATLERYPLVKEAVGSLADMPWCAYVLSCLEPSYGMWKMMTCLRSGYATLLERNWELAVAEFVKHVIALDKADEIRSDKDAHFYFTNFVNRYHATGMRLLQTLKQRESGPGASALSMNGSHEGTGNGQGSPLLLNRGSFEQLVNGQRYADGKPIPSEAPPRPSATAQWDAGAHQWSEFYS